MKSRRFVCFVALAGASLLLSSCGESKNPLSDPLKAKPDAQLAGVSHQVIHIIQMQSGMSTWGAPAANFRRES